MEDVRRRSGKGEKKEGKKKYRCKHNVSAPMSWNVQCDGEV